MLLDQKKISINRVYNICCALKTFVEFHLVEIQQVFDVDSHPDYIAMSNLLRNLSKDKQQESKLYRASML